MGAVNEVTGVAYQKGNVVRLEVAEFEHGYDVSRGWAGFRQWLSAGRVVRKGEHGTACVTVVAVSKDESGRVTGSRPRGFRVFHWDQTCELGAEAEATVSGPEQSHAVSVAEVEEAPDQWALDHPNDSLADVFSVVASPIVRTVTAEVGPSAEALREARRAHDELVRAATQRAEVAHLADVGSVTRPAFGVLRGEE